jgi:hypothetical protein
MVQVRKALFAIGCAAGMLVATIQYIGMLL